MNILYSYEAGSTYEHIVYEEQRDDCGLRSKGLDFIDDLGERWLHDDTTLDSAVEAIEREKRSKEGWRICTVCAPLNIYPFYGKGWGNAPRRAGRGACSCARVDRLVFRVKLEAGLFSLKIE